MPKEKSNSRRSGTQSIERAAFVLREVALRGKFGWGLSELSAHCGLDKATTYRILSCLVREQLLSQKAADRRYQLGPLLFELGISVANYGAFVSRCQGSLERLSSRFEGHANLVIRSGAECVYAARAAATSVKSISEVGARRPLYAITPGIAILICLPATEAKVIIKKNERQMAHMGGARVRAARRLFQQSAGRGYVINEEITNRGLSVFAVPIVGENERPVGALSIGGPSSSYSSTRAREVIDVLKREARRIAKDVNSDAPFVVGAPRKTSNSP